jgi:hypothetical protein
MNHDAYLVSRLRTCDVLRAIAAGHTTIRKLREVMPSSRVADIRNSIISLRRMELLTGVRNGGEGNQAIYEVVGPVEKALEQIMPKTTAPDASELERAMGMPECVQATLAVMARGRVVLGAAGLNARG